MGHAWEQACISYDGLEHMQLMIQLTLLAAQSHSEIRLDGVTHGCHCYTMAAISSGRRPCSALICTCSVMDSQHSSWVHMQFGSWVHSRITLLDQN